VLRAESRLERLLHDGTFCVTAEVVPPRSADPAPVTEQAEALAGFADAVNVTDNPTAAVHMSPVAGAALVAAAGLEPILQLTCRDRNRLGLTSDLLGAWALGARNVLCMTGDPSGLGDHPDATPVFDLDVFGLIELAVRLREEGRLLSGQVLDPAPRYFVGAVEVPLVQGYDPSRLERKADAGADFVQTQIVYDADAMGEWAEGVRARGLLERLFVLVGVAPPRSPGTLRFMREHLPGVVVPDHLVARMEAAGQDAQAEGVRVAVEVVEGLRRIEGIRGVHVMGIGHEAGVRRVIEAAGLLPRPA
jgi:methylenetetrahydrofolate reductase (NADPH)